MTPESVREKITLKKQELKTLNEQYQQATKTVLAIQLKAAALSGAIAQLEELANDG
jgi:hypothetical protein